MFKTYITSELIPNKWRNAAKPWYAFNPSITRFDDKLFMVYRVVLSDGIRRMAICRLDEHYDIIPESVVPLSDEIKDADSWQADPRFCVVNGRLYIHFNNGFKRPNRIYLLELSPETLLPSGPTRPLELIGARREIEKNWMLFGAENSMIFAVYQIAPHIVLRLSLEQADTIPCIQVSGIPWDSTRYSMRFGQLRGSTPPVRVGDLYYSFFHSVYRLSLLHGIFNRLRYGRRLREYRYAVGFYGFSAHYPFKPVCYSPVPILLAPPRTGRPEIQLNRSADRVVYPAGAVYEKGIWLLSFGLHDEHCCLQRFSHEELLEKVVPISV